jgi:hypothetical protein
MATLHLDYIIVDIWEKVFELANNIGFILWFI